MVLNWLDLEYGDKMMIDGTDDWKQLIPNWSLSKYEDELVLVMIDFALIMKGFVYI